MALAPPPAQVVQELHPDMSSTCEKLVAVEGIVSEVEVVLVEILAEEVPETVTVADELKLAPVESHAFAVILCDPEETGMEVSTDETDWL